MDLTEIFLPGLEESVGPVAKAWTGPLSNPWWCADIDRYRLELNRRLALPCELLMADEKDSGTKPSLRR